jgi:hypothetical protein
MIQLGGKYCTIFYIEFGVPMKLFRLIQMYILKGSDDGE